MDDPSFHLIELKKLCKKLQQELAPVSRVNTDCVHAIAKDIVDTGSKIYWWSKS